MQLQLGDCLFWSTGLHWEMISTGFWVCAVGLIRAPLYCGEAPADEAFPMLRQINTFLSRLSSGVLAAPVQAEPTALRRKNVCPLTLAYLNVSPSPWAPGPSTLHACPLFQVVLKAR